MLSMLGTFFRSYFPFVLAAKPRQGSAAECEPARREEISMLFFFHMHAC